VIVFLRTIDLFYCKECVYLSCKRIFIFRSLISCKVCCPFCKLGVFNFSNLILQQLLGVTSVVDWRRRVGKANLRISYQVPSTPIGAQVFQFILIKKFCYFQELF